MENELNCRFLKKEAEYKMLKDTYDWLEKNYYLLLESYGTLYMHNVKIYEELEKYKDKKEEKKDMCDYCELEKLILQKCSKCNYNVCKECKDFFNINNRMNNEENICPCSENEEVFFKNLIKNRLKN